MDTSDLTALRSRIDAIDARLIELLAERFRATDAVGRLKASAGLAAVDAAREAQQALRYRALAAQHALSSTLVDQVFRQVIDEVVRNHRALADAARPDSAPT